VEPLVLITGFGSFEHVGRNASREVAQALEREPPRGVRVRAAELPVAFAELAPALARELGALYPERPDLLLGLGVQKLPTFRLERRSRGRLEGRRPDVRGTTASALVRGRNVDRTTPFDLERLARVLAEAGAARVEISDDAGGYVCERAYYELLEAGRRLDRPALFLHVPPAGEVAPELQAPIVRALVAACLERLPGQ
jgi:pyrrolidone-carboxylate peptidase